MARAAIVTIDCALLERALGFAVDVRIDAAQLDYSVYHARVLQLVISGDSLPAACTITEGQRLLHADVVVHTEQRHCEIIPRTLGD